MQTFVQPPQISYRKWVLKLSTLRNPQNGDTLPNLLISPVSVGHLVVGLQYCYHSMHGAGMGVVWQHTWHCELVCAPGGGTASMRSLLQERINITKVFSLAMTFVESWLFLTPHPEMPVLNKSVFYDPHLEGAILCADRRYMKHGFRLTYISCPCLTVFSLFV